MARDTALLRALAESREVRSSVRVLARRALRLTRDNPDYGHEIAALAVKLARRKPLDRVEMVAASELGLVRDAEDGEA